MQNDDSAESDARLENLAELVGSIMEYEAEAEAAGEAPSLATYLERVTLASDVDQMKDTPRLVMMTVHSAKGLEFRSVFLTGMEDELFPSKGWDRANTKSSKKSGASRTSRSRAPASNCS